MAFGFLKRWLDRGAPGGERRAAQRRRRAPVAARVLIVDDSTTVRAVLGKMLAGDGYRVIEAADGESAVELARADPPDLIFLDIVLPGMSGFSVLRTLRRSGPCRTVPIVMMSGNQQAAEQFYVRRVGADGFLKKPFGRGEVFHAIDSLVQAGRLARAERAAPVGAVSAGSAPSGWGAVPEVAMPDAAHLAARRDEAWTVVPAAVVSVPMPLAPPAGGVVPLAEHADPAAIDAVAATAAPAPVPAVAAGAPASFDFLRRWVGRPVATERRAVPRTRAPVGTRILVVDDSATVRAVLGKMLMQDGYHVLAAVDGEGAVEIAMTMQPDLIFLDIVLPGASGFAVLRALRRGGNGRTAPVVMMSGNQQAAEQFYVQRVGADGFLKKPFGRSEVFHAIEAVVRTGRLPRRADDAPAGPAPGGVTPVGWDAAPAPPELEPAGIVPVSRWVPAAVVSLPMPLALPVAGGAPERVPPMTPPVAPPSASDGSPPVAAPPALDFLRRWVTRPAAVERRALLRMRAQIGARVLVVDDSATVRAVLGKLLAQDGYRVLDAADGETGIKIAMTMRPDLIFLDIVLPGTSGFAVLRALRHGGDERAVPVVMMSGNQQAAEQFYVQRVGADGFLKKPFGRVEVFHAVESLVRAGRLPQRTDAENVDPVAAGALPAGWDAVPEVAMPDAMPAVSPDFTQGAPSLPPADDRAATTPRHGSP